MSRFVLVPGAGGAAWYWHRVLPELESRGHEAVAVDIPEDDPALGLPDYADLVVAAVGEAPRDVVLVAQSMGAFTAPVVATRVAVRLLVLLNPMIPLPGETPGAWWEATGQPAAMAANDEQARRPTGFTEESHFLHDVPPEVVRDGAAHQRGPAGTPFGQPCDITAWPDVPTRVLLGRDDRFFPLAFARRVAHDRLGIDADEVDGGHLVALSQPAAVAERLAAYAEHP